MLTRGISTICFSSWLSKFRKADQQINFTFFKIVPAFKLQEGKDHLAVLGSASFLPLGTQVDGVVDGN